MALRTTGLKKGGGIRKRMPVGGGGKAAGLAKKGPGVKRMPAPKVGKGYGAGGSMGTGKVAGGGGVGGSMGKGKVAGGYKPGGGKVGGLTKTKPGKTIPGRKPAPGSRGVKPGGPTIIPKKPGTSKAAQIAKKKKIFATQRANKLANQKKLAARKRGLARKRKMA